MFRRKYLFSVPGNYIELGKDYLKQNVKTSNGQTMKDLATSTLL